MQRDREILKKKLTEQEYLMRRSERIAALEKELAWYREESLAQSKVIAAMREEMESLKQGADDAKTRVLEMDAVLAKYKRKSKILQSALYK